MNQIPKQVFEKKYLKQNQRISLKQTKLTWCLSDECQKSQVRRQKRTLCLKSLEVQSTLVSNEVLQL